MERAFIATDLVLDFENLFAVDDDGDVVSASPIVAWALACGLPDGSLRPGDHRIEGALAEKCRLTEPYITGFHHGWFGMRPRGSWPEELRLAWRDGAKCHAWAWADHLSDAGTTWGIVR